MAGDPGYHEHVMELLTPLGGVLSRPMFGGYGIYHDGAMFALISGSSLYFKVDDSNRAAYEDAGSERFERMPYFFVPADVLEAQDVLLDWARTSMAVGHATAKKKKPKGPRLRQG